MPAMSDFPIQSTGRGAAYPVFGHQLAPATFDDALGATEARETWERANAEGLALHRVLTAKQKQWLAANRESDFSDRADYLFALDRHLREEDAAVKGAGRHAVTALRAYREAQRSSGADLVAVASEAAREADTRARQAVEDLEKALQDRSTAVAHTGGTLQLRNLNTQIPQAVKDLVNERVLSTPHPAGTPSARSVRAVGF